jgi:hypothetical protein
MQIESCGFRREEFPTSADKAQSLLLETTGEIHGVFSWFAKASG